MDEIANIDGIEIIDDFQHLEFFEDVNCVEIFCSECRHRLGRFFKPGADMPKFRSYQQVDYWGSTNCTCGLCYDLHVDYDLHDIKNLIISQDEGCISALSRSNSPWSDIIPPATEREGLKIDLSCDGTAYDGCGCVKYAKNCSNESCRKRSNKKNLSIVRNNCNRLICRNCGTIAAYRKAHKVAARLVGMHKAYWDNGIKLGKIRHVIWSSAVDSFSSADIISSRGQVLFNALKKILKLYGRSWGGVLVLHLWRKKHLDGTECETKGCGQPHKWVYGPHIHFIGCGWFVPSDEVHKETGWIYKTIERKNTDSLYNFITDVVGYQLSHCAVFEEKVYQVDHNCGDSIQGTEDWKKIGQSVRYYGLFSTGSGGKHILEKSTEIAHCPDCKNEIHKYLCDDEVPDYNCDIGECVLHIELVEWYINFRSKKKTHEQLLIEGEDYG